MPDHHAAPAPASRRPHTGRRRNEAARQAVLDAAAELLGRPDGAATSMEEIVQASGVSKHTIYRWWPSKGAVLLDAMVEQARHSGATLTGSFPADLETFLTATFRAAERAAPLLRSAMAEAQRDPQAAAGMRRFAAARRAEFRQLLAAGQRRGELPGGRDLDLLVDQVYGLLWYRLLIGHAPLTADVAARLTRELTKQTSGIGDQPS